MTKFAPSRLVKPTENLVAAVAAMCVRRAIRPYLNSPHFIVAVRLPNLSEIDLYKTAAWDVLDPYRMVDHDGNRRLFIEEATALHQTGWSLVQKLRGMHKLVVLYSEESQISADLSLTIDKKLDLVPPGPAHYLAAARHLDIAMTRADAEYLASQDLNDVRLALRPGRPVPRLVDALKAKENTEPEPEPRREDGKVHLQHLSGYGDAKVWGLQLAEDLRLWMNGTIPWADVDRGIVLSGPPGCGKTTFAGALANTCSVKLITASAAEWQAKGHLGDMLAAMRKTFKLANASRPCILFIDEFDSVGDRNAHQNDSHHDYKRQVVNAMLECLDPAGGREGVVIVAATNHPQCVDDGLLRPGRLERVIEIALPDEEARKAIIRYHLPGQKLGDLAEFLSESEGWSGAQIEKFARDVRRIARKSGRTSVGESDLFEALPKVTAFSPNERFRVAIHEMGHAIVGYVLRPASVVKVKISRGLRNDATSVTMPALTQFQNLIPFTATAGNFLDSIAIFLGGMAAEQIVFGDHGIGCGGDGTSDLGRATDFATMMEKSFGFGDQILCDLGFGSRPMENLRAGDPGLRRRIQKRLQEQYQRASEILVERRGHLDVLAKALARKSTLSADEIGAILASTPAAEAGTVPAGRRRYKGGRASAGGRQGATARP